MRAVVDTSVLVRGLLGPEGGSGAVVRLLRQGAFTYAYSSELLEELIDVLRRPRLRAKHMLGDGDMEALLRVLRLRGEAVEPMRRITVCRDPEDDKVLEAALAGRADVIVSVNEDLLSLGSFEGIPVVPPEQFLAMLERSRRV